MRLEDEDVSRRESGSKAYRVESHGGTFADATTAEGGCVEDDPVAG